jgi:hypothetical protein
MGVAEQGCAGGVLQVADGALKANPRVQTAMALLVMAALPADEKGSVLRLVDAATKAP